jgi:hypothetical protein
MNYIDAYHKQTILKRTNLIFVLLFWVPGLLILNFKPVLPFISLNSGIIALILMGIGYVFIKKVVANSKCPACSKNPGSGWKVKSCKSCGEQLTPVT